MDPLSFLSGAAGAGGIGPSGASANTSVGVTTGKTGVNNVNLGGGLLVGLVLGGVGFVAVIIFILFLKNK